MMKEEFEALAGEVSEDVYKVIEFIYTFHPAISETDGKRQVAELYKLGGLRLMRDMIPTAERAKALEEDIREKVNELAALREDLANLRRG